MGTTFRIFFGALLFGLWFWICHYWYTCHIKAVCYDCQTVLVEDRYPLDFQENNMEVLVNDDFQAYQKGILEQLGANNQLIITGKYHEGEIPPDGFADMGLARATQIKALFLPFLSEDRIEIKSRLVEKTEGSFFPAADFKWEERVEKSETVEILEDRVIIRFPFSSVRKIEDPDIDAYLVQLANELKGSRSKVFLTGHTDNVGGEERNYQLALRRAKMIRDILRKKGVKPSRIITESEGESAPLAPNSSEEGRRLNRRVEVVVK